MRSGREKYGSPSIGDVRAVSSPHGSIRLGRRRLDPGLSVPGVVAGAPATGCNLIPQAHERLGRTERAAVRPPDGCWITDPDPKVGL